MHCKSTLSIQMCLITLGISGGAIAGIVIGVLTPCCCIGACIVAVCIAVCSGLFSSKSSSRYDGRHSAVTTSTTLSSTATMPSRPYPTSPSATATTPVIVAPTHQQGAIVQPVQPQPVHVQPVPQEPPPPYPGTQNTYLVTPQPQLGVGSQYPAGYPQQARSTPYPADQTHYQPYSGAPPPQSYPIETPSTNLSRAPPPRLSTAYTAMPGIESVQPYPVQPSAPVYYPPNIPGQAVYPNELAAYLPPSAPGPTAPYTLTAAVAGDPNYG